MLPLVSILNSCIYNYSPQSESLDKPSAMSNTDVKKSARSNKTSTLKFVIIFM